MRYLTYTLLLAQRLACAGAAEIRRRRDRNRSEPGPVHTEQDTEPVRVILPSMMTGRRAPDLPPLHRIAPAQSAEPVEARSLASARIFTFRQRQGMIRLLAIAHHEAEQEAAQGQVAA